MTLIALLLACPPEVSEDKTTDTSGDTAADTDTDMDTDTDTDADADADSDADADADSDTDTDTDADPTMAVLTTTADDYSAAVMATISIADWTIADSISTAPTDSHVAIDGDQTFVLGRYGYNYVRVYDNGDYAAPLAEQSTGPKTNPQDANVCGGKLFVSNYGSNMLNVYNPETLLLSGTVDLSAYDDGDGYAEAAGMVEYDGMLYLAVQQLDQNNGWVGNGGKIVEIDCTAMAVTQDWDAGPNPSISEWPDMGMIVRTGVYYTPDYSDIELDGSVYGFNPATGLTGALASESAIGMNIDAVTMVDSSHGVSITSNFSGYAVSCVNGTSFTPLLSTTSYLQGAQAVGNGSDVWIMARQNYIDPTSSGGIIVVDAVACTDKTATGWLKTGFAPYSVAFY